MKPDLTVVPARQIPAIEKRRPLTRAETIALAVQQNGKCGCGCGGKLDALREGVIEEHRVPLALGGSNDLDNRELWRKPCSAAKTAGKDAPAIAKAKRLAGETCNAAGKPIPVHIDPWGKNRPGATKPKWPKRSLGKAKPYLRPPKGADA